MPTRTVELTRVYHFSAAHCLANPRLSPADNAVLYGQCARPHGHNYYLEVTVAGLPDPMTGFAADLEAVDRTVAQSILEHVDHHQLEHAPPLAGVITTGGDGQEPVRVRGRGGLMSENGTLARLVSQLLKELGEDAHREGLERTPERVATALRYLTSGYNKDPREILNDALFVEEYDEMVVVKDIDVFSLCEHHILPFIGKCHVAYMPRKKIVGLSKIPRLVDMYARRLQVQERLTTQIANTLNEVLQPRGVAVVIEAIHLCMLMRGVEKQNSKAVTSAMLGAFRERPETRAEFMELIKAGRGLQI